MEIYLEGGLFPHPPVGLEVPLQRVKPDLQSEHHTLLRSLPQITKCQMDRSHSLFGFFQTSFSIHSYRAPFSSSLNLFYLFSQLQNPFTVVVVVVAVVSTLSSSSSLHVVEPLSNHCRQTFPTQRQVLL